jgi:hypothetical protein
MKQAAARDKDLADIEALKRIQKIIRERGKDIV